MLPHHGNEAGAPPGHQKRTCAYGRPSGGLASRLGFATAQKWSAVVATQRWWSQAETRATHCCTHRKARASFRLKPSGSSATIAPPLPARLTATQTSDTAAAGSPASALALVNTSAGKPAATASAITAAAVSSSSSSSTGSSV